MGEVMKYSILLFVLALTPIVSAHEWSANSEYDKAATCTNAPNCCDPANKDGNVYCRPPPEGTVNAFDGSVFHARQSTLTSAPGVTLSFGGGSITSTSTGL